MQQQDGFFITANDGPEMQAQDAEQDQQEQQEDDQTNQNEWQDEGLQDPNLE